MQNFTAATDNQGWGLKLVTVIHDVNYTQYKKVLKNYNHKTFIYNVHVKMVAWGLQLYIIQNILSCWIKNLENIDQTQDRSGMYS